MAAAVACEEIALFVLIFFFFFETDVFVLKMVFTGMHGDELVPAR